MAFQEHLPLGLTSGCELYPFDHMRLIAKKVKEGEAKAPKSGLI